MVALSASMGMERSLHTPALAFPGAFEFNFWILIQIRAIECTILIELCIVQGYGEMEDGEIWGSDQINAFFVQILHTWQFLVKKKKTKTD